MEKWWWPRRVRPRLGQRGRWSRGQRRDIASGSQGRGLAEEGDGAAVSAFGPKVGGPGDMDGLRAGQGSADLGESWTPGW